MGHEREGTLKLLWSWKVWYSHLVHWFHRWFGGEGWFVRCVVELRLLQKECYEWSYSNQQQKSARERERQQCVTMMKMFHLFLSSLHELLKLKLEDIFLGVWADSVLSYIKFKPFWERRTVLLPQIFRLKTWQRDPTETTEKHIRKTKVMMLWAIESNDTFLASHQTLIPPLDCKYKRINSRTQGL